MNAQLKAETNQETAGASVASPAEEGHHFSPRAKHPVVEMTIRCQTEAVEKILDSYFDPVQKSLYHLHVTLPIVTRASPQVIIEVMDLVENRFEKIEHQMDVELGRLKVLAKTDGAVQPSNYTNPSERVLQAYTPEMARWAGLLMRMDEILRWVDALWFSTRIKSKDRSSVIMQWRNTLIGFSRELNNLHMRASVFIDSESSASSTKQNIGYIMTQARKVKAERKAGNGGQPISTKQPKAQKAKTKNKGQQGSKPASASPAAPAAAPSNARPVVGEPAVSTPVMGQNAPQPPSTSVVPTDASPNARTIVGEPAPVVAAVARNSAVGAPADLATTE